MNHCVDCLHWDEESDLVTPETGFGVCGAIDDTPSKGGMHLAVIQAYEWEVARLTCRGDFGCNLFTAKLATPRQSDEPVRE